MLLTRLMNTPQTFQRKVALGLGLLTLVLLAATGWLVAHSLSGTRTTLHDMRTRAGSALQILNIKQSQRANAAPDALAGLGPMFQEATSLTIGRANLQSRLDAIVRSNALVLASAVSLPDSDEHGYSFIGLRIDISGSDEAIHKAVVDIETIKPPLFIREFSARLTAGEAGDRPVEMAAQLKIFTAFRLTGLTANDPSLQKQATP